MQDSKYAVLAGIPVAVLGLAAWIAALALTVWNSELARTLTAALALGALAFAAYLVILQLFVIDAICVWCMATTSCWSRSSRCSPCCGSSPTAKRRRGTLRGRRAPQR